MLKSNSSMKDLQDKIGRVLSVIPLSPNQWTLLSFLLALSASFMIFQKQFFYGAVLFLFAILFDALDGAVARATNRATKFGAFFDGLIDRLTEGFVLISLFFNVSADFYTSASILFLLFFGTCMTSFVRAYAHHRGVISDEDITKMGGFFERGERTILIFLMLLVYDFNLQWFSYLAMLGAVLSVFTFLQRFFYVYARGKNG